MRLFCSMSWLVMFAACPRPPLPAAAHNEPPWRVWVPAALKFREPLENQPLVSFVPAPSHCAQPGARWISVSPSDGHAIASPLVRCEADATTSYQEFQVLFLPAFRARCEDGDAWVRVHPLPLVSLPHSERAPLIATLPVVVACAARPTLADLLAFQPPPARLSLEPSSTGARRMVSREEVEDAFTAKEGAPHVPPIADHFDFATRDLVVLGFESMDLDDDTVWTPPDGLIQEHTVAVLQRDTYLDRCTVVVSDGEVGVEGRAPPKRRAWLPGEDRPYAMGERMPLPPKGSATWASERHDFEGVYGLVPVDGATTDVRLVLSPKNRTSGFCRDDLVPKVARSQAEVPVAFQALLADVDFEQQRVAWLVSPDALSLQRTRIDSSVRGVLPITIAVAVDCDHVVNYDFSALSAIYVLPRSSTALRVGFVVNNSAAACH